MTHPALGSANNVWLAITTAKSVTRANGVANGPDVAQADANLGIRQVYRGVAHEHLS